MESIPETSCYDGCGSVWFRLQVARAIVADMRTGLVLDRRYEAHDAGPGHPERPERIRAIRELMTQYRREGLVDVEPRRATDAELALNHDRDHVARVASTASRVRAAFDADTQVCSESYAPAALAAGG